jgi:hypothetical protein
MKYLVRIVAISVAIAGLIVGLVQLFNRLCDSYSKLLFRDDPDEYYSWPV